MLTARHCVEEAGNINDVTYVRFEENALAGIGDYGSLQDGFDAEWMAVETVVLHPLYDDYAEFPNTCDIGVVILADCGDSGGPTFFKDTNIVVSVTSFGWAKNGNCVGNDFNLRTDVPSAQDFIELILNVYGD